MKLDKDEKELIHFALTTAIVSILVIVTGTYLLIKPRLNVTPSTPTVNIFKDEDLGWDFSNYKKYNFNDCGVRDSLNCNEIKSLSKRKIMFLGNSVVMGKVVKPEETFSKQVQTLNTDLYIINAGFDGFETYREIAKYKRDLSDLGVSHVALFLNRNDLVYRKTVDKKIAQTKKVQNVTPQKTSFSQIYLNSLKNKELIKFPKKHMAQKTEGWIGGWKDRYYYSGLIARPNDKILKILTKEIYDFALFLEKSNTTLSVILLPDRTYSKFYGNDDSGFYNAFKSHFNKLNIQFISLVDDFKERKSRTDIYADYVHLNKEGHRFAGEVISSKYIKTIMRANFVKRKTK